MALGLLAAAAVHAVTGACFLAAGVATLRRRTTGMQGAGAALAAWWLGLAGYLAVESGTDLAASAGRLTLDGFLATRWVANPLLCAGAGGLTYYILYLLTGRGWLRIPVFTLFAATLALFMDSLYVPAPRLVVSAVMAGVDEPGRHLLYAVYLLVGLPPILASAALLAVSHRMPPPQRYRARMVGAGILAYVGGGLAAFLGSNQVLQVAVLDGVGLVACLLVMLAYYPPQGVRQRFGIEDPAPPAVRDRDAERAARRKEFQRRSGELL